MRAFLGILAGLVVALAVQSALDYLGNTLYPPHITDMWSRAQMMEAFATRPTNALLITVAGYFLGSLIGGAAGKSIWRRAAAAWTPAVVLAAMAALIGASFPVPTWFLLSGSIAALVGGLLANHLVKTAVVTADPAAAEI